MAQFRLVSSNQQELNMQRAVLNRATMRVAETTEVSGRGTADDVNLDRFHNQIREMCTLVASSKRADWRRVP
jgi:hypothetical protein